MNKNGVKILATFAVLMMAFAGFVVLSDDSDAGTDYAYSQSKGTDLVLEGSNITSESTDGKYSWTSTGSALTFLRTPHSMEYTEMVH